MHITTGLTSLLLLGILLSGCAMTPAPAEPPALPNTARDQIGHLAIRGPTRPTIMLADNLNNKGAAARKTAADAGMSWLNGSFEAAASGGEGGILLAAFGLVTTPIVVAGGAVYGAVAADTEEAIAAGNDTLENALNFAPAQLRGALAAEFGLSAPVIHEFVGNGISNFELRNRGFDSVLDVEMERIASRAGPNDMHVYFETISRVRLTSLINGQLLINSSFRRELPPKAVSSWADADGGVLKTALDESFTEISEQLVHELFLAPAIRMKGLQPVSRGHFGVGTVPGRRPLFVWSSLDGGKLAPQEDVRYEIVVMTKGVKEPRRFRTGAMHYVPVDSLEACRIHSWQVRAHYLSFGERTTSEWTPTYRFKTEC